MKMSIFIIFGTILWVVGVWGFSSFWNNYHPKTHNHLPARRRFLVAVAKTPRWFPLLCGLAPTLLAGLFFWSFEAIGITFMLAVLAAEQIRWFARQVT